MTTILDEKHYEYPDTEYEYYTEEIHARFTGKGDKLEDGIVIGETKAGPKWADIRDPDGVRVMRVPADQVVTVRRRRQTDASREADRRADRNMQLARDLAANDPQVRFDQALEKFNEEAKAYKHVRYDRIDSFLQAQADLHVWRQWVSACEWAVNPDNTDPPEDLYSYYVQFVNDLKGELFRNHKLYRGTSRSTSVISNVMDDFEREAVVAFIDSKRFW